MLDGLKTGNAALEKANAVFSLEEVESIMSDTVRTVGSLSSPVCQEEAVEKQREIERMLSGGLSQVGFLDLKGSSFLGGGVDFCGS